MSDFSGAKLPFLFQREFALIYMIKSFIKRSLVRICFFPFKSFLSKEGQAYPQVMSLR